VATNRLYASPEDTERAKKYYENQPKSKVRRAVGAAGAEVKRVMGAAGAAITDVATRQVPTASVRSGYNTDPRWSNVYRGGGSGGGAVGGGNYEQYAQRPALPGGMENQIRPESPKPAYQDLNPGERTNIYHPEPGPFAKKQRNEERLLGNARAALDEHGGDIGAYGRSGGMLNAATSNVAYGAGGSGRLGGGGVGEGQWEGTHMDRRGAIDTSAYYNMIENLERQTHELGVTRRRAQSDIDKIYEKMDKDLPDFKDQHGQSMNRAQRKSAIAMYGKKMDRYKTEIQQKSYAIGDAIRQESALAGLMPGLAKGASGEAGAGLALDEAKFGLDVLKAERDFQAKDRKYGLDVAKSSREEEGLMIDWKKAGTDKYKADISKMKIGAELTGDMLDEYSGFMADTFGNAMAPGGGGITMGTIGLVKGFGAKLGMTQEQLAAGDAPMNKLIRSFDEQMNPSKAAQTRRDIDSGIVGKLDRLLEEGRIDKKQYKNLKIEAMKQEGYF